MVKSRSPLLRLCVFCVHQPSSLSCFSGKKKTCQTVIFPFISLTQTSVLQYLPLSPPCLTLQSFHFREVKTKCFARHLQRIDLHRHGGRWTPLAWTASSRHLDRYSPLTNNVSVCTTQIQGPRGHISQLYSYLHFLSCLSACNYAYGRYFTSI